MELLFITVLRRVPLLSLTQIKSTFLILEHNILMEQLTQLVQFISLLQLTKKKMHTLEFFLEILKFKESNGQLPQELEVLILMPSLENISGQLD